MRCPTCGHDQDRVVDSRAAEDGLAIRRRRECLTCGARYTTFERAEHAGLLVRKRNGGTEPFERAKVLEGMVRATSRRVAPATLEAATDAVESALRAQGREVTSEQVGLQVLAQLRDIDPAGYMRFASVYKDFQRPEDFEQELKSLSEKLRPRNSERAGSDGPDEPLAEPLDEPLGEPAARS